MSRHHIPKSQKLAEQTTWTKSQQRHDYVTRRWYYAKSPFYKKITHPSGAELYISKMDSDDRPDKARIDWDGHLFMPDKITKHYVQILAPQSIFFEYLSDASYKLLEEKLGKNPRYERLAELRQTKKKKTKAKVFHKWLRTEHPEPVVFNGMTRRQYEKQIETELSLSINTPIFAGSYLKDVCGTWASWTIDDFFLTEENITAFYLNLDIPKNLFYQATQPTNKFVKESFSVYMDKVFGDNK